MKPRVFVDGQEGTTGLEIAQRLEGRDDLELLVIDPALRKDPTERRRLINAADVVFLCLPDDAARESASLVDNPNTCVIDASTAHRTNPAWVYGFPELRPGHRAALRSTKRISVPGCHATGFVAAVAPLVARGLVPSSLATTCLSLTGYSGGGKKLIATYENEFVPQGTAERPRMYALGLRHKHLPEMAHHTGLTHPPVFTPILVNLYKGMVVSVPLALDQLGGVTSAQDVHRALEDHYRGERFVRVMPFGGEGLEGGYLEPTACNDTNRLELFVFGTDTQALVAARLDNLGKGASGAAVQCMNIHLGLEETAGLPVEAPQA